MQRQISRQRIAVLLLNGQKKEDEIYFVLHASRRVDCLPIVPRHCFYRTTKWTDSFDAAIRRILSVKRDRKFSETNCVRAVIRSWRRTTATSWSNSNNGCRRTEFWSRWRSIDLMTKGRKRRSNCRSVVSCPASSRVAFAAVDIVELVVWPVEWAESVVRTPDSVVAPVRPREDRATTDPASSCDCSQERRVRPTVRPTVDRTLDRRPKPHVRSTAMHSAQDAPQWRTAAFQSMLVESISSGYNESKAMHSVRLSTDCAVDFDYHCCCFFEMWLKFLFPK